MPEEGSHGMAADAAKSATQQSGIKLILGLAFPRMLAIPGCTIVSNAG